ncbi:aldehyde dehydrogenase family protein [Bacillus sp. FJAT-27231]|uniref:aldehyde dehydrogenase family protein n=1 Tax=Bacillus sp. FJAT-27231 TaxID=1679168 RepID=UPI00067117D8|nr:aldehyde dehydrogenase family protein [Bacillus sp. FJAT-27231]
MILDADLQSIQEMRIAVQKAKKAQQQFLSYSQQQIDHIVQSVAEAAFSKSAYLAGLAVEETKMGIKEHKKIKNELGSKGVYESIKHVKTVGVINDDIKNKVIEIAYPYGVIAAITPTTNPTSTAIYKTLIALKSQNSIVFSPHPTAAECTVEALKICQEATLQAGAPEGIIGWVSRPSMTATTELMKHRDINLILATGGGGLVRAAYSSGKPAYGVGPGNVPVYIDQSADVNKAVKMIVDSKRFDNSTICATEQAIVVHSAIKSRVMEELSKNKVYLLNPQEKSKVAAIISPALGKINPGIVGKPAVYIAKMAGISVPKETVILLAEEVEIGKEFPFSLEKLSPVFGLYTAGDESDAITICEKLLNIGGRGHSVSIHSKDDQQVKRFAEKMPVSRVLVNTLASIGAAGGTTGLTPSFTLGCGSYGGNITSDNITVHHLINIKRVAYGIKEVPIPVPKETQVVIEDNVQDDIYSVVDQIIKKKGIQAVNSTVIAKLVSDVLQNYQTKSLGGN